MIEKLPNFIAQKTGIMPLIHLREKAGKEYLEIEVQPSAMPISVHGRYYTRSGSVTSELQGNQLNMFLAAKMGLTWESVIEEDFSRSNLSRPHNKLIADIFYKAGFIESWGRGTQRIIDNCVAEGLSALMYEYKMGFLYLTFSHERVNELTDIERAVYRLVANKPSVTQLELAAELQLTVQYIRKIMKALKDKNYIERVGADKNGYWKIIEKS